jgi:uncharacterized protein YcfJ
MSTRTIRIVIAVLITSLLGSCTNIKNDGTRTRTEGALAGSIGGALLGAGIGALTGRGGSAILAGALAGAAAGGIGGYAYGNHVANKKASYASREQWLKACISQAKAANQKARNYNSSLTAQVNRLRSEVNSAKASGDKGLLKQKQNEILRLQKDSTKELQKLDNEIKLQERVLGEAGSSGLKQEVISMRGTRSSMKSNYDRLASLNREIDV